MNEGKIALYNSMWNNLISRKWPCQQTTMQKIDEKLCPRLVMKYAIAILCCAIDVKLCRSRGKPCLRR